MSSDFIQGFLQGFNFLPFVFALLLSLIGGVGMYYLYRTSLKLRQTRSFNEQLSAVMETTTQDEVKKESIFSKWNDYWDKALHRAGLDRFNPRGRVGFEIVLLAVFVGVLPALAFKNVLVVLIFAGFFLGVVALVLRNMANSQQEHIFNQLSGFIFSFKANIEARRTPEQAFLSIVDDLPEPLYSELISVKQGLLASVPFSTLLQDVVNKTSSRDLRFFASCLLQATSSGGDIVEQLGTIQRILEDQRVIKDEIQRGVKTTTPVIWATSAILPLIFGVTMIADPTAREFWFQDPISYPLFIFGVMLYLVAVVSVSRIAEKTKKLY